MKAFLQACAVVWILTLPACGGSAEGNTDTAPSTAIKVPLNPLPLSERN